MLAAANYDGLGAHERFLAHDAPHLLYLQFVPRHDFAVPLESYLRPICVQHPLPRPLDEFFVRLRYDNLQASYHLSLQHAANDVAAAANFSTPLTDSSWRQAVLNASCWESWKALAFAAADMVVVVPFVGPAFVLKMSKGLSLVVPLEERLSCFATLPRTAGSIAAAVLGCAAH